MDIGGEWSSTENVVCEFFQWRRLFVRECLSTRTKIRRRNAGTAGAGELRWEGWRRYRRRVRRRWRRARPGRRILTGRIALQSRSGFGRRRIVIYRLQRRRRLRRRLLEITESPRRSRRGNRFSGLCRWPEGHVRWRTP